VEKTFCFKCEGEVPELYDTGLDTASHEDFFYRSWNGEGDLGGWTFCRRLKDGWHVLLCGEWSCHSDFAYAGLRKLSESECAAVGVPA